MIQQTSERSERIYRALLLLYPRGFRESYATDAVELFRDRLNEARRRGPSRVFWLWVRTVPNMLVHGLMERASDFGRGSARADASMLRNALRSVLRSPALSATIVVTLGVGIGANVALYSVLRGVLLRPLPYPEAERLVRLWETNPEVDEELHGPSPWNFADWERSSTGFESMAAWYLTSGTYRTEGWVEELRSAQVTADFFRTLGVAPIIGRDFRAEEVTQYGPVMLSYKVWQRLFGGDPAVVGRTIVSSSNSYEIVGVMPQGFAFPDESVETWVAWDLASVYATRPEARTWRFLDGIGRLLPETSMDEAEQELDRVAAGLAEAFPDMDRGWDVEVTSLLEEVVGDVAGTLWIAFASVAFILLIACANVASLLLARVPARTKELAIRMTLGASRGRVARELLAENFLLAVLAGLLGLALGSLFLGLLVALDAGRIPRLAEVSIDIGVFAFTVVVSGLTSVVFGLVPVLQAVRGAAVSTIGHGGRTTASVTQRRVRETFVAGQVAVALVLLTGAGLFSTSLQRLMGVDPGLNTAQVATFRVSLDPVDRTDGSTVRYYEGLVDRLEAIPGVMSVGAAQTLPLNPIGNDFRRPYRPTGSGTESADAPAVQIRIVTSGYVDAIGMTVIEGTNFPHEVASGEPLVAIVNQTLADRLWPGGGGVGETFDIDFRGGWLPYRIVGVVQDVKHYGLRADVLPEAFLSHRQVPYVAMSIVAKTVGAPGAMFEALRAVVLSHQPMQPAHSFVSLDTLIADSTAEERFLSILLTLFAGVGLVLAGTGVYGVIAYSVSHRGREIGVRMALGAEPGQLVGSVLMQAVVMAGVGLGSGVLAVVFLSRLIDGLLYAVEPTDPLTMFRVGGLLLVVSLIAAYLPARKAAWVSPSEALRSE